MNRSMPTISARPATGIVGIAESVAASVTKPPPGTAAAPFDVSSSTARMLNCAVSGSGVFVACAMKIAAIVM